ncbi:hypothetical protein, partial [Streptomyces afghaniensis]|uniref:hypothetical protein n=1 Tax=Streptomyces afghaniensis TaxID=66865 RepID=UPI0024690415
PGAMWPRRSTGDRARPAPSPGLEAAVTNGTVPTVLAGPVGGRRAGLCPAGRPRHTGASGCR